jgi:hypothetical protein
MSDLKPIKKPTAAQTIMRLLSELDGPISADDLIARLLAINPSQAKNPHRMARSQIRDRIGKDLVFLDEQTISPMRIAMRGAGFRLPIDKTEGRQKGIGIRPTFEDYLPLEILWRPQQISFLDAQGQAIPVLFSERVEEVKGGILGLDSIHVFRLDLGEWNAFKKSRTGDHCVFTIDDWEQAILRVAIEPGSQVQEQEEEIERQDAELVRLIFEQLEKSPSTDIMSSDAVSTALARLSRAGAVPHHYLEALETDGRMISNGFLIRYAEDGFNPLFADLFSNTDLDDAEITPQPITRDQERTRYRFSAQSVSGSGVTKEVIIRGGQTLSELDNAMRKAFRLDRTEHLGGFWRLIPRGERRFREVKIGSVPAPSLLFPENVDEGESNVQVATLDLKPGDRLKYVYDFGDWVEFRLTLDAVELPKRPS